MARALRSPGRLEQLLAQTNVWVACVGRSVPWIFAETQAEATQSGFGA
jgi:hypothetical protein